MGMFDSDIGSPFTGAYQEGEVFTLQAAKVGPRLRTDFGQNRVVLLTIDGKTYSIFGEGIVNQVEQMEKGDLPAKVKVVRIPTKTPGQEVKKIVPESWSGAADDDIPL